MAGSEREGGVGEGRIGERKMRKEKKEGEVPGEGTGLNGVKGEGSEVGK